MARGILETRDRGAGRWTDRGDGRDRRSAGATAAGRTAEQLRPSATPAPVVAGAVRGRRGRALWKWVPVALAAAYAAYSGCVYGLQERFIFERSECEAALQSGQVTAGAMSVWINTGSVERPIRVEAWYFPATGARTGRSAGAVMFFHGSGDLIETPQPRIDGWRERGYGVLMPEYRGYGRSGGEPSERAIVSDACRFYDWLASRPDVDPGRIILHGLSLGGGVAAQVALRRHTEALILESTFTSVAEFFPGWLAPPALCDSPFHTDRVLPTLERPVLILHGAEDEVIPAADGRRLHELAKGSVYAEMPGHHDDFPLNWKAYWAVVDRFIADLH